ncbi:hypothetical protein [Rhizobium sp. R86522]|jgi:hypothetical protein|uniref:hypothetical protein n=1 Tax=Rhizobium sp. R86522 TaxID=3093861 RepID=UPI0036719D56
MDYLMLITPQQTDVIRSFRHEMRLAGCWGACFEVACFIEHQFDWRRIDGVYELPDGRPIFLHSWNMMSDGTLVDGTADQFGEGRDIAIHPCGSPDHLRYRDRYTAAHNPLKTSWLATRPYSGVPDQTFWDDEEARRTLAPGWWISEPQPYVAWFKSGATMYPMFRTMRERYRQRGYEIASLE